MTQPAPVSHPPGQRAAKRAFDIVAASTALTLAAVPMAVIALAIRRTMGRPVLFRQTRPGRGGRPFTLVKFRTMRDGADDDASRITPLGSFLRATSLDELPELWNVLKGDMSLVGPRPLLVQYLGRYNAHQARRHEVRPGITGLAQVEGRNLLSWEERFDRDVAYVDSWTLVGDLGILARTVWSVIRRQGISAEGHATMPEFQGTPS
jgi:lipopolysaccharide/colanic/teichoic acid biosynthesis glycosyltransferase